MATRREFEWRTTTDRENVKRFLGVPRGTVLARRTSAARRAKSHVAIAGHNTGHARGYRRR
jgi:hypothetical protein